METNRGPPPAARAEPPSQLQTNKQIVSQEQEETTGNELQTHALTPNGHGAKTKPSVWADQLRRLSISPARSGRVSPGPHGPYSTNIADLSPPQSSSLKRFWIRNKPSILVALSQFFGALMNLSARLLELEGEGMHPVQVLLLRQGLTVIGCCAYMWWMNIPHFPFGKKEIRWLLLARGFSGFFGIYGMWYSMMYLPLADATVITFLAPGVAGMICYFVLREPFTRTERIATIVALLGVVLIAQPVSLFAHISSSSDPAAGEALEEVDGAFPGLDHEATAEERLVAVGVALLGVLGAAGAFTTLRTIGKRAHPLISVNFFGMTCTVICVATLLAAPMLNISQPHLRWIMPSSLKAWLLLFSLGTLGFIMQYLLTSGLAADKSNRANAMVYTHMLFAVSFDRWIFGHSMGMMSFAGCALILGSAITVVLMKRSPAPPKPEDVERQGNLTGEAEGSPMLIGVGGNADEVNLERSRRT